MRPKVGIYRPNNDISKGSAFQFSRGLKKQTTPVVWVEAVNQTNPKPAAGSSDSPFSWDGKITLMLNHNELAEISAFVLGLSGAKDEIKLVHKTDAATSGFQLTRPKPNDTYGNWGISIFKKPKEGTPTTVRSFISVGEVYQIVKLADYVVSENVIDRTQKVPANGA